MMMMKKKKKNSTILYPPPHILHSPLPLSTATPRTPAPKRPTTQLPHTVQSHVYRKTALKHSESRILGPLSASPLQLDCAPLLEPDRPCVSPVAVNTRRNACVGGLGTVFQLQLQLRLAFPFPLALHLFLYLHLHLHIHLHMYLAAPALSP
ncbi:hypothetical protein ACJQWK_01301 [Exserohilum turcicum]